MQRQKRGNNYFYFRIVILPEIFANLYVHNVIRLLFPLSENETPLYKYYRELLLIYCQLSADSLIYLSRLLDERF